MRWEDERYVRLYTRDTITWKMLPWQGRALLALLFRKVDRAGLIDVGEYGPDGLAALVELPVEVVSEGLASLIKCKTAQWAGNGTVLFLPKFLEAQEAHQSDAQRKRDQRERSVAKASLESIGLATEMSHGVTDGHKTGPDVTTGHTESQVVTAGHSDPIRSVPSLPIRSDVVASPNVEAKPKAEQKSFDVIAKADTTPKAPSKPKAEPLPFKPDEAIEALAKGSQGRFVASRLNQGHSIAVTGLIRKYPELEVWEQVGRWIGSGGESWMRDGLDIRNIGNFEIWVARMIAKTPQTAARGSPLPLSTSVDDRSRQARKF